MSTRDALEHINLDRALKLKERLNWPFLVTQAILTFLKNLSNLEHSEREIREAVGAIVCMIPKGWRDKKFQEAYKAATIEQRLDVRPRFCGNPATLEYCEERGIVPFKTTRTFDYYKLFQAVVDLLDRLHVLSRREYTEIMAGVKAEDDLLTDLAGQLPEEM